MTPNPGSSDGRYTLQSELARGGMGKIWIAEDARLARKVAIKELLAFPSAEGQRARFERELSLTSRLEHPSIVSIQDGGTWPDGKPYYVMKLVRGESLERVIDRARTLADRIALLPYGLAVVDALAYAHAQGIVHRDLKPDNVIVGDFGETVVIDWGLAKDLRAATPDLVEGPYRDAARADETLGGEVIGTPAYMSPEQAMGDAVNERADVYALGAVLYHVISGERPYRGATVEEVLANVISAPPQPLAERAPDAPVDLVTIVEKAMAREPEDRYATAGELAIDLKRFQSGQLVAAHHYTSAQLIKRWLRKHRTAVVVAGLALVTLATFGAVSFARIVREQHEAEAARALAESNRQLAEERRVAAEGLVTFMLGDLRASLEPIGKIALLELPAKKSIAYFGDRSDLAPEERQSRAVALENLGDALRDRGDLAGAETQLRAALADRAALVAAHHDKPQWHDLDAILHADLGDLAALRGASDQAVVEYRASVAAFAELARSRPNDTHVVRSEQKALEKLAGELVNRHDMVGADHEYRVALALATARAKAMPGDLDAQADLTAPEHAIGDLLTAKGDIAGAVATYSATLARVSALTKQHPEAMDLVRMEQLTDHRLGIALQAQQDLAGAVRAFTAASARCDQLVAHDPDNFGWRYEQALTLARLGQALVAGGDATGGMAADRHALAILAALAQRDKSNLAVMRDQMTVQLDVADQLATQKKWRESETEARSAVAIGEARAAKSPQLAIETSDAYASLGTALMEQHHPDQALDVFAHALDVARSVTTDANDANLQQALVNVGDARCAAHHADAQDPFTEAQAISARHLTTAPADPTWTELDKTARTRAAACKR